MCVPYYPFSELVSGDIFEFHPCCMIESIGLSGKTAFIKVRRDACRPVDFNTVYIISEEMLHSTRVTVID